jgi:hypothetical protein
LQSKGISNGLHCFGSIKKPGIVIFLPEGGVLFIKQEELKGFRTFQVGNFENPEKILPICPEKPQKCLTFFGILLKKSQKCLTKS